MTVKKKVLWVSIPLFMLSLVFAIYYCNYQISKLAVNKQFDQIKDLPFHKTGILLGTSKFLKNGKINPYYQYRIDASYKLFVSKKINFLVISGDNSNRNYNEPELMKEDLKNMGVDTTKLFLDFAGFRTFDSMVRLKEIFGQDSVTIISQKFHNERALYIADKIGMNAVAFNAKDVVKRFGFWIDLREKIARVKVFIDIIFGVNPKFLGKKIEIK